MRRPTHGLVIGTAIAIILVAAVRLPAQPTTDGPGAADGRATTFDQITASEEFRWGVTSLHDGRVNEAIASLTRSISFDSSRPLVRYWLGRAFFFGGFDDEALREWLWVRDRNRTSVLDAWIERIDLERGLTLERLGDDIVPGRYVTMVDLPGIQGEQTIFRRPAMLRPRSDGFFYVPSFGTNVVVLFDPNGVRRQIIDGGLEGLDRPFDLFVRPDGSLLVSEFGADRIAVVSPDGFKTGTFGSHGVGAGYLIGPQYLAGDSDVVYVSDYGNARVAKFTVDGEFLFHFGTRTGRFAGLRAPAGIVVEHDRVYVADTATARIEIFDESGNHLGHLANPTMQQPEGISLYSPGRLLVTDRHRLFVIDVESEQVFPLVEVNDQRRLIGGVVDANRNLLVSDFASNSVLFMAASEELYTGVNVEIESVRAVEHPDILVTVSVTDRNGLPLLGLNEGNFRITEDRLGTGALRVVFAGYQETAGDVVLLTDRSSTMAAERDALRDAGLSVSDTLVAGDRLWVVSGGDVPVVELRPGAGRLEVGGAASGSPGDFGSGRLDLGIRLAGSQIIRSLGPRSIILVSDGVVHARAFEQYGLSETERYLANNDIRLSVVYTRRNARSTELDYLATASGGSSAFLYTPEGIGGLVSSLLARQSGRYVLSYRSVHDTDFGRRYIPLEIETYLLDRSGRDEAGFFGPLVF